MQKKLGITVSGFNLSIFLYSGIIEEYKKNQRRLEKSRRYKKGDKVSQQEIQKKKERLMKELYNEKV